jgi:hypothetical protein
MMGFPESEVFQFLKIPKNRRYPFLLVFNKPPAPGRCPTIGMWSTQREEVGTQVDTNLFILTINQREIRFTIAKSAQLCLAHRQRRRRRRQLLP